jgi:hypothetical protein
MANIGIEWVNKYHGRATDLKNNDNNAEGFYNTLDGVRQFEYGDDLAWDQDFEQSGAGAPVTGTDQLYADAVDIVFFSGHGSTGGAFFGVATHDDGTAKPTEMRLGDLNCEWAVLDACLVLAYSGGGVYDRVRPVFKGLHHILGFDTTTGDSGSRGKKFAQHLNDGWTMGEAWRKACEETEDSSVWWAYIHANTAGTNTYNDHWHGKGFVSADPVGEPTLCYHRGAC